MRVFGKKVLAGEIDQIIETAINAFSYSRHATDLQDALNETIEENTYSQKQIEQSKSIIEKWNAAAQKEIEKLRTISKEQLREALQYLSTTEGVDNDELNQGAIQELKISLGQG